ncbi:MAG: ribonuclease HII [Fimbriimonadales bacterium]|nr:ribonuclease HII [Fimbriimonadales bacterium]
MRRLTPALQRVPGAVGVDEAGRGPLAGPVVAAAVLVPEGVDLPGLNDSKRLSPAARATLAETIRDTCRWAVAEASVEEIDRLNILHAALLAMRRAVESLNLPEAELLVDGDRVPEGLRGRAVVKGDASYACIAAASVLAKEHRDRIMLRLAREHPGYGFERHFGYPTPEHLELLRRLGPSPVHRRSFAPCRDALRLPNAGR